MARGEWGGDSGKRGLQELLERTHGQNRGWGDGGGGGGRWVQLGWGGGKGRKGIQLIE